jgi:glucose-6-phosphate isomerase
MNTTDNKKKCKIRNCPLPVMFDSDTYDLLLSTELICNKSASKSTEQMRNLLRHPDYAGEETFFTFYEGVMDKKDVDLFKENMLRYDIIVVWPGIIGDEYKKTSGHYHCEVPGQELSYPEIYEVMQGNALFILQKCNANGDIVEVFAVRGNPGDKLVIPPGYGHVTTNIGNEPLIFADLVSSKCSNIYGQIGRNRGMSYYVVKDDERGFRLIKNPAYQAVPEAKLTHISENYVLGIWKDRPIYSEFVNTPTLFEYLNKPVNYIDKFIKF